MDLTPLKAIRKKCLDCSGHSQKEVRECVIPGCPLYPYRMGKNPARKGIGDIKNLTKSAKSSHSIKSFQPEEPQTQKAPKRRLSRRL